MKLCFYMLLLAFVTPAFSATDGVIKKTDQCIDYAEDIGIKIKTIAVIARSTKAGSIKERKIFLKKLKSPIRKIKRNLRKCGRKMKQIDKTLPELNDETKESWEKSQRKFERIDKFFNDALEQIPGKKDAVFLKPLNAAMKKMLGLAGELTFYIGAMKSVRQQLKAQSKS